MLASFLNCSSNESNSTGARLRIAESDDLSVPLSTAADGVLSPLSPLSEADLFLEMGTSAKSLLAYSYSLDRLFLLSATFDSLSLVASSNCTLILWFSKNLETSALLRADSSFWIGLATPLCREDCLSASSSC